MKQTTKGWLGGVAAVLALAWLCFVGFIGHAMRQPPERFAQVMAGMPTPAYFLFPFETMWTSSRRGRLEVGDNAPDLKLVKLTDQAPVQLASLWAEKPVVLVFGSYT